MPTPNQTTPDSPERADADEAILRGSWLHEHHAPINWVILTTEEIAAIRADLAAQSAETTRLAEALKEAREYAQEMANAATAYCNTPNGHESEGRALFRLYDAAKAWNKKQPAPISGAKKE